MRRVSCQANSFKTRTPRLIACDTVKRGFVAPFVAKQACREEYFYSPAREFLNPPQSSAKFRRAFRVRIIGEKKEEKEIKKGGRKERNARVGDKFVREIHR